MEKMLKFRPSNRRTSVAFNELQLTALVEKGLSDNCLRGFLYKRSSTNSKWRMKWFLLFENLLFYFDISPQEQQEAAARAAAALSGALSVPAFVGQAGGLAQVAQVTVGATNQSTSSASKTSTFDRLIRRQLGDKSAASSQTTGGQSPSRSSKQVAVAVASAQEDQWRDAIEAAIAEDRDYELPLGSGSRWSLGHQRRASAGGGGGAAAHSRQPATGSGHGRHGGRDLESLATPVRAPRARLQSDPAQGASSSIGAGNGHNHGELPGQRGLGPGGGSGGRSAPGGQMGLASSSSRASSRTLNSSSISGVSGHFQTHNEQTIGRSTTTTAGKTPTNYSSLLNRKIGVIFLEGSYCERLVDAAVDFEAAQDLDDSCSSIAVAATNRLASLQQQQIEGQYDNCCLGPTDQFGAQGFTAAHNTYDINTSQQQQQQQSMTTTVTTTMGTLLAMSKNGDDNSELYCTFTLKWRKEGSKEYQFRTETEAECQTWVHAISSARYSTLLNDKEQLEQKYLHLSQIIESESTAKWQYSRQCEELSAEIKKLRQEICLLKRQESRSNQLRLVLSKSAAIVEQILKQQRKRQAQSGGSAAGSPLRSQKRYSNSSDRAGGGSITNLSSTANATTTTTTTTMGQPQAAKKSDVELAIERLKDPASQHHQFAERPVSCDPHTLRGTSPLPAGATSGSSPGAKLPLKLLTRTRSMEQEQAEQEQAVRRARRYNVASYTRLASLDERGIRSQASQLPFGASGGGGGRGGMHARGVSSAALAKSLVRAASSVLSERLDEGVATGSPRSSRQMVGGIMGSDKLAASAAMLMDHADQDDRDHDEDNLIVTVAKRAAAATGRRQRGRKDTTNDNNATDTHYATSTPTELAADSKATLLSDNSAGHELGGVQTVDDEEEAEVGKMDDMSYDSNKLVADLGDEEELSVELKSMVEALNNGMLLSDYLFEMENSEELRKIKKVQGFFRGWLCRRRWKQIVQEYIKSPHAESMRKRNNLVFRMVECEEEYVDQLNLLISAFLRPIKMAASSQRPALSHDELNSIFLNSETLLFLHQIFLKGLTARMESWPTLVLGDLFNMLLPMLTIYQEYVRNHHFSLQVLAECKQRDQFSLILRRLEEKPQLGGRTLETFLTYPMHQIPRYIICLHEILAHTPHNHVEKNSLYEAQIKLEELSRQMHDEVSETENIRQNLAIERMIIGGCDILLDVNQGILLQVIEIPAKCKRSARSRLASFATGQSGSRQSEHNQVARTGSGAPIGTAYGHQNEANVKELVRQCFLFTNHLLLCTRTKDGKLHLLENIGRVSLSEVTLIENPVEFIQQQETIQANFESIARPEPPQHHERVSAKGSGGGGSSCAKNLSCSSISECQQQQQQPDGGLVDYASDKRASTASMPSKWNPTASNSNQYQGTPTKQQQQQPTSNTTGQLTLGKPTLCQPHQHQHQQQGKSPAGSKRTSFAGFATQVDDSGELTACSTLPASDDILPMNSASGQRPLPAGGRRADGQESSSSWSASFAGQVFASSSPQPAANLTTSTTTTLTTKQQQQQPAQQPQRAAAKVAAAVSLSPLKSSLSSRGSRITGYLANKLSNLTNLGSLASSSSSSSSNANSNANASAAATATATATSSANSQQQQQQQQQNQHQNAKDQRPSQQSIHFDPLLSSSAPSSPLNKRQPPLTGNGAAKDFTGGCAPRSSRPSTSGSVSDYWGLQPPFSLAKDYGGCDFILLLESTSKVTKSSAQANSGASNDKSVAAAVNSAASGGGSTSAKPKQHCNVNCSATSGVNASYFSNGLLIIHLVAPNLQEKAAWMSDISQCIDNVHFNDLFHGTVDSTSVTVNQSVRTDPRLYKDDVDIKFSRALNSCKLPQIRYASISRLFERLTDLRFLSIDFLNTFLLTYRVFTTAEDVLEALKGVHYNSDRYYQNSDQLDPSKLVHSSFCQYANSSMSSLNVVPTPAAGQQSAADADNRLQAQQHPPASNHFQQAPASGLEAAPNAGQHHQNQLAKPATQQLPLKQLKPSVPPRSPGADASGSFLLAPNAYSNHQKRRSTISALTPITGSNSSSVVNLAGQQARQQASQVVGSCSTISVNSPKTLDCSETAAAAATSNKPPFEQVCDRARSSSTSSSSKLTLLTKREVTGGSSANLTVPGPRQTRASSVSLTPKDTSLLSSQFLGHQTNEKLVGSAQPLGEGQHWRLSYKRSQKEQQSSDRSNHLAVSGSTSTATRRASAAAEISVTLQVTPVPSPGGPFSQVSSNANPQNHEEEDSISVRSYNPNVPPSTPIEPTTGDEADQLGGANLLLSTTVTNSKQVPEMDGKSTVGKSQAKTKKRLQFGSTNSSGSEDALVESSSTTSDKSNHHNGHLASLSKTEEGLPTVAGSLNHVDRRKRKRATTLTQSEIEAPTSREKLKLKSSKSLHRQESLAANVIKEIDLAQAMHVLDCDTSADEDKVLTSESSDSDADIDDDDEDDDGDEIEDAKAIQLQKTSLLSKLNNVKLDDKIDEDVKPAKVQPSPATKKVELVDPPAKSAASQTAPKPPAASSPIGASPAPPTSGPSQLNASIASDASRTTTPRSSFQHHTSESALLGSSKAGVIVTASAPRVSSRRSSTASAASAFAAATAASNNPILTQPPAILAGSPFNRQQLVASRGSQMPLDVVGQLDSAPCSCNAALRRGSYTPSLLLKGGANPNPTPVNPRPVSHHPNCLYFQQQVFPSALPPQSGGQQQVFYANPYSEASSLCNSRASSRLSSCAGIDYSSHSSVVQFNPQQQQQQQQQPALQSTQQPAQQMAGSQGQVPVSQSASLRSSNAGQIGRIVLPNPNLPATPTKHRKKDSNQINIRSVATIRVLSVLRHWVSKHAQDFTNEKLSRLTQEFLQELIMDSSLLPAEHKAAVQLQQMVQKAAHSRSSLVDLDILLAPPPRPSLDSVETLSALEIAEGMTYLDHKIFLAIRSEEFLGQAWMKADKAIKAPHILLITKRFNDVSRLVSSEIIRVADINRRVGVIEKWTNVAHICRVVHNFNGVLQICAAFTNSAVFRLKKTWDKIPKNTKTTIEQLQGLVSTDSRFRNMRDAINRCDPPSIPYVGMYLTDLSFIEEGTPNYSSDNLLNFSKMRMIAHVIREIQHLQNGNYKIPINTRVADYLLDSSRHLQDDEMYRCSLALEPRTSSGKNGGSTAPSTLPPPPPPMATTNNNNNNNSSNNNAPNGTVSALN